MTKPTRIIEKAKREIVIVASIIAAASEGIDLAVLPAGTIRTILAIIIPLAAATVARQHVMPVDAVTEALAAVKTAAAKRKTPAKPTSK
jgi:ABC-type uncharacterized transport system permease subunit